MGITKAVRKFERETLRSANMDYTNLRICELGNQYMDELENASEKVSAKRIYATWGAQHLSIDLNGEDGAIKADLDKPISKSLMRKFDLVTNYGTLEHVNNQFQGFKNVHDLSRKGGVMIHTLPPPGSWQNHARYYYPKEFVTQLALVCEYKIINLTVQNCFDDMRYGSDKILIMVAFQKSDNEHFPEKEVFDRIPILDTHDLTNTGNYTKPGRTLHWRTKNWASSQLAPHPRIKRITRKILHKADR